MKIVEARQRLMKKISSRVDYNAAHISTRVTTYGTPTASCCSSKRQVGEKKKKQLFHAYIAHTDKSGKLSPPNFTKKTSTFFSISLFYQLFSASSLFHLNNHLCVRVSTLVFTIFCLTLDTDSPFISFLVLIITCLIAPWPPTVRQQDCFHTGNSAAAATGRLAQLAGHFWRSIGWCALWSDQQQQQQRQLPSSTVFPKLQSQSTASAAVTTPTFPRFASRSSKWCCSPFQSAQLYRRLLFFFFFFFFPRICLNLWTQS